METKTETIGGAVETDEEKALKYNQRLEAFKIDYSKVKIEQFDFTKVDPVTI